MVGSASNHLAPVTSRFKHPGVIDQMRLAPLCRTVLFTSLLLGLGQAAPVFAESVTATVLAADTRETSSNGTRFTAPGGWQMTREGSVIKLAPPEQDSRLAVVDVEAATADSAVAKAWEASGMSPGFKEKLSTDRPARDGWDAIRMQDYDVPANKERAVMAYAAGKAGHWTVLLVDFSTQVLEKRGAQFALVYDRMLPKGYERETFAGLEALPLDADRLAAMRAFIGQAQKDLGVPGVSVGIVQNGKVVMAEGFGVRELGKSAPVDADTLYMVASNTKAMTTLMLGRLVDAGKLRWDTPVTEVFPGFRLGNADTTRRVLIEHLVCACTGLPRQDFEWLMEFKNASAASTLQTLATMQPTSDFGALFQYSNPLASAGGYIGAHLLHPDLELGAAYDRAMQEQVFAPLGMDSTTFDIAKALAGNHAAPHAWDMDSQPRLASMDINYSIRPVRPAGGAWSNVDDMLRYVQMELDRGLAHDGNRLVSEEVIDERRKAKVAYGNDAIYGMGLETDRTWGVPVVNHGGSMIGYKSNMIWLPEHGVGAVILTNADEGGAMLGPFQRRLLELLFDGKPEAADQVATAAANRRKFVAAERALMVLPADPVAVAALAPAYRNTALGDLAVAKREDGLVFDFGEWRTDMASRTNADGSLSFYSITPGMSGLEFVDDKGGLVMRTAQQEYRFEPVAAK